MAIFILTFAFSQGVFPKPPDFAKLNAFDLSFLASHPKFTLFLITALAVAVLVGFALLSQRVKAFWERVRQGLTILFDRRRYLREVFAWQFAGWCFRFMAFWFLLEAFNVGGSVRNVLLVLGVNAVAAVVPFTPGGAGVQQALLVKVFAGAASGATVAAYSVGQQIVIAVSTLAVGFGALVSIFRIRSFKEAIRLGKEDRDAAKAAERGRRGGSRPARTAPLLQALTRLAHERDRVGEDHRHDRADLLGLLIDRSLDVDAVDRRDGHLDRELDRVVGPDEALLGLHRLRELGHLLGQLVGVAEESSESTFHDDKASWVMASASE